MRRPYKITFLFALIVYALFSSPTPDVAGWAEALVGLLLIASIRPRQIIMRLTGERSAISRYLLMWGFSLPLILSLYYAQGWDNTMRDLIPFVYLILPYLILSSQHEDLGRRQYVDQLAWVLAAVGALLAIRFFIVTAMPFHLIGEKQAGDNLLYLSSSPLVPYATIFLLIQVMQPWQSKRRLINEIILRTAVAAGGIISAASLAATVQRATVLAVLLMLILYGLLRIRKKPIAMFGALLILLCSGVFLYEPITGTLGMIWIKTLNVLDNARLAELRSVWDHIAHTPSQVILGNGWGAQFYSPAAGFAWVRYTHTLFSYALFKGGVIGLILIGGYVIRMFNHLKATWWHRIDIALAVTPSILLGFTLYPTFKMLGFGALLCLVLMVREVGEKEIVVNE